MCVRNHKFIVFAITACATGILPNHFKKCLNCSKWLPQMFAFMRFVKISGINKMYPRWRKHWTTAMREFEFGF